MCILTAGLIVCLFVCFLVYLFVYFSFHFLSILVQVIFSSSQTYELMHCLDEIRLSFRTKEYLGHSDQELSEDPSVRPRAQGPGMKSSKSTKVISYLAFSLGSKGGEV